MIHQIKEIFYGNRNDQNSIPMEAYLKNQFTLVGLKSPERRELQKTFVRECKSLSEKELITLCKELYELPEREFHYLACDLIKKYLTKPSINTLKDILFFITKHSWWDTVDTLAVHFLGNYIKNNPGQISEMDKWIKHDNFWVRRSAILYQLKYKEDTNEDKLIEYCILCAHEKEFFIRKAIGWVLREYSRTNPSLIVSFVESNNSILSPLSKKEALRLLI